MSPRFDTISQEFSDAIFLKLNVSDVEVIAKRYNVTETPTFIFFKDGNTNEKLVDATEERLRVIIGKY